MVLYLISTPIGNLSDMTFRAVQLLQACDYILCEDTRHSQVLLSHHGIQRPLKSYHRFNEAAREAELIADLVTGLNIALISDAGTPGLADPGERLVRRCVSEGLSVVPVPGPCALIAALTCSGLSTERFQFIGFVPRKASERQRLLIDILDYPGTTICYEAPHRLVATLTALAEMSPDRPLVMARELTKKFEEFQRGTARELLESYQDKKVKGELVLLISGAPAGSNDEENVPPETEVAAVQKKYGLSRTEAIKFVAQRRGVSKRDLYQQLMKKESHD